VVSDAARRQFLDIVPPGTPSLVLAPAGAALLALAVARRDPALHARAFGEPLPAVPVQQVLLEGLDALDDPAALLRSIRAGCADARLFALAANAAYAPVLAAFAAGADFAGAHPLVLADLEPAFRAGGWEVTAIEPLVDREIPPPVDGLLDVGTIGFAAVDAARFERLRTAAYLIAARGA
jgi:hypothetical protein